MKRKNSVLYVALLWAELVSYNEQLLKHTGLRAKWNIASHIHKILLLVSVKTLKKKKGKTGKHKTIWKFF